MDQAANSQPAHRKDQQQQGKRCRQGSLSQLPGRETEQDQAGKKHHARTEAVDDAPADNRSEDRSKGQGQEKQARLESAQTTQLLEIDRNEDQAAEKTKGDQRTGNVTPEKRPIGK